MSQLDFGSTDQAVDSLRGSLLAIRNALAIADSTGILQHQKDIQSKLESLATLVGLSGSLKINKKWLNGEVARGQQQRIQQDLTRLAELVRQKRSFSDSEVCQSIGRLSNATLKELKELAKSVGVSGTGSKPYDYLIEMVEAMTGVSSLPFNASTVESYSDRLDRFYKETTESVPEKDMKQLVKDLKALDLGDLFHIASRFGLEDLKKKKPDIIKRIESKIRSTSKSRSANLV